MDVRSALPQQVFADTRQPNGDVVRRLVTRVPLREVWMTLPHDDGSVTILRPLLGDGRNVDPTPIVIQP